MTDMDLKYLWPMWGPHTCPLLQICNAGSKIVYVYYHIYFQEPVFFDLLIFLTNKKYKACPESKDTSRVGQ